MTAARLTLLWAGVALVALALAYAWTAPGLSGATITATLTATAGTGCVATALHPTRIAAAVRALMKEHR